MLNNVIGVIKLAPGEVGFYDEFTRIHLTIGNAIANVVAGMNTTNIKRAVASGRVILLSGMLEFQPKKVEPAIPKARKKDEPIKATTKSNITSSIVKEKGSPKVEDNKKTKVKAIEENKETAPIKTEVKKEIKAIDKKELKQETKEENKVEIKKEESKTSVKEVAKELVKETTKEPVKTEKKEDTKQAEEKIDSKEEDNKNVNNKRNKKVEFKAKNDK